MSNARSLGDAAAKERRQKLKYIELQTVPASELPFRVIKERTGVLLGSFETQEAADDFIDGYPLEKLKSKPTRRPYSR